MELPNESLFGAPFCFTHEAAEADITFVGIPYAGSSFCGDAAARGPELIRRASRQVMTWRPLSPGSPVCAGGYSIHLSRPVLEGVVLVDAGDVPLSREDSPDLLGEKVFRAITSLGQGRTTVLGILGGDHSISWNVVSSLDRSVPTGILCFDAHLDAQNIGAQTPLTHANWLTHASRLPHVSTIVHVGCRGIWGIAPASVFREGCQNTNLRPCGIDLTLPVSCTPEKLRNTLLALPSDMKWHISVDVDVLDPVFAPATGRPVPGGMAPAQLLDLLLTAADSLHVASFDITEVAESPGEFNSTALTAAMLIPEFTDCILNKKATRSDT